MKKSLFFFFTVLIIVACKKAEDRACLKTTGSPSVLEVPLSVFFDRYKLGAHITYLLVQDSTDKVVIRGGKNLIRHVQCSVKDGLLEISNKNRCAMFRNAKKELLVEIHCTSIANIHFEGTEPLKSVGVIHAPYFSLTIRDGAGSVSLNLRSISIHTDVVHGWGDYTLTGETQFAHISARSNGYCDAFGLEITDSLYVASETPGIIKVRANNIPVGGYLKGSGDIWFKGIPSSVSLIRSGSGKWLDKN